MSYVIKEEQFVWAGCGTWKYNQLKFYPPQQKKAIEHTKLETDSFETNQLNTHSEMKIEIISFCSLVPD